MSEFFEKRTLRDALRVVFRRWHVFLVAAAAFAVVLICSAHYWPLRYTGTAFFRRTVDPAVADLKIESFESLKRELIWRLGGREAVEKVIEDCELDRGWPHGLDRPGLALEGDKAKQELVAEFQKRLRIDFRVESSTIDLVSVEFTHENATLASKVPNVLVSNYMESVHKSIYDSLAASKKFLEEQGSKCKTRLDELEQQRLEFQVKHAGMFPDSPDALQTRIDTVQADLKTLKLQQKMAREELERLESLGGTHRPADQVPEDGAVALELEYRRMKDQLQELLGQLVVARLQLTDRHPTVINIKESIGPLEARAEQMDPRIVKELAKLPLDPIDCQLLYTDLLARLKKLDDELSQPAPGSTPKEPAPSGKNIKGEMTQLKDFVANKVLSALPEKRKSEHLGALLKNLQRKLEEACTVDAVTDAANPAVKALKEAVLNLRSHLPTLMPKVSRDLQYRLVQLELQCFQDRLDIARQVRRLPENSQEVMDLREGVESLLKLAPKLKTDLPMRADAGYVEGAAVRREDLVTAQARAEVQLEVTTAEIERLENQLKQLEGAMANFTVVRQQYLELLGKIQDEQAEATRWKVRQDEVQMALDAEVAKRRTHLESVQTAETQFRPSSPSLLRVLAMAYVGGLAFGGGVVFLLNYLDRSISTTEEAGKYFNVPVHGVIGEIITAKRRLQRKFRRYVLEPVVALIILGALGSATLSISLWLNAPDAFKVWKSEPASFVVDHATSVVEGLWRYVRS